MRAPLLANMELGSRVLVAISSTNWREVKKSGRYFGRAAHVIGTAVRDPKRPLRARYLAYNRARSARRRELGQKPVEFLL
jgi:hypothetical protein